MEYRLLGQSGLKVPVICFGTATFGGSNEFFRAWGTTRVEEASRLIDVSIELGCNFFDTANSYSDGMSEEILGKAIGNKRDQVLVATKVSSPVEAGPNGRGASRHHMLRACEASLRRLGTDYIDVYQIHGFDALTPIEETLRTLDDLVRSGKVRYVGCSNYSGWHLMKSLAIAEKYGLPRFVEHQAYYSLLDRDYEWELMPLGIDQNVGMMVWSPLAGGRLTGKLRRNQPPPSDSRLASTFANLPADTSKLFDIVDVLDQLAIETGKTVTQVALNWLLQQPTITTLVIGARNEVQLRENIGASDWNLSKEQVQGLNNVSAKPVPYPYWHQRGGNAERNPIPVR